MVKASNQAMCSVCGHLNRHHEKTSADGTENRCVVEGLNDAAHLFASSTTTLWSSFIPFKIPEPILYIPTKEDVLDIGGFSSNGTWTGTETYEDDHAGVANGAMTLDGASRVNCANESKYDFEGTDKFTICCWVNATSTGDMIFGKRLSTGLANTGWSLQVSGASQLLAEISDGTNESVVLSAELLSVGIHHIVMTYSGNQNESGIKLYYDGILTKTGADDDMPLTIQNDLTVSIGAGNGGAAVMTGSVSEATIWDRELTAAQIAFLYNSGTGRTLGFNLRNGLVLFNKFNGNLTDETGDNVVTVTAGTEQYAVGRPTQNDNNAQAFDFDNLTRLNSDNEGTFDFVETDPFTISAWVKTSTTGSDQIVVAKTDGLANTDNGWALYIQAGDQMRMKIMDGSGNALQVLGTTPISDGEWHHVVGVYSGSALESGLSVWIDGVETTNASATAITATMVNNFDVTIGAESDTGASITGQIQHAAIWNRKLSAGEITHLFNNGTPREI